MTDKKLELAPSSGTEESVSWTPFGGQRDIENPPSPTGLVKRLYCCKCKSSEKPLKLNKKTKQYSCERCKHQYLEKGCLGCHQPQAIPGPSWQEASNVSFFCAEPESISRTEDQASKLSPRSNDKSTFKARIFPPSRNQQYKAHVCNERCMKPVWIPAYCCKCYSLEKFKDAEDEDRPKIMHRICERGNMFVCTVGRLEHGCKHRGCGSCHKVSKE